jgi:predicted transport protein
MYPSSTGEAMSDIRLFRMAAGQARELQASTSDLEKPLQTLLEKNLEPLLGVRFLASEYPTGKTHSGRIDTLGLDEDDCPVILEYKRSSGENVINQGLFYLDWLMDHQAEFKLLVLDRCGKGSAEAIDWTAPRLVCVASDFTKYDGHAVQQMNRNIELIRYRLFGSELLLLELVNAVAAKTATGKTSGSKAKGDTVKGVKGTGPDKTVTQWLKELSPRMQELFGSLDGFVSSLGDDVQRKELRLYIAYKRLKNFVTVVFQKKSMYLYLRLDPKTVKLDQGFSRDVSQIGHWGTGDVQVMLKNAADLERAKPLVRRAYEGGAAEG